VSTLDGRHGMIWYGQARAELLYGPICLRIVARRAGQPHAAGVLAAAEVARECLDSLAPFRALAGTMVGRLRTGTPLAHGQPQHLPAVLRLMIEAALATGEDLVTPLIAVAGSIAQMAMDAALAAGADTAVMENGGDVALTVAPGDTVRLGVARSIDDRGLRRTAVLSGADGIGGVCTSGLGGRSFTLGVADAAVAFGPTAAVADACATLLANATFVPDPAVERDLAEHLDPDTDIPGFLVVTAVGTMSSSSVAQALQQAERRALAFIGSGLITGALVAVQGREIAVGTPYETICSARTPQR
jgi:ApbE superfamily uncharacterized protein (UPF0280 family)